MNRKYFYQHKDWPDFIWDSDQVTPLLIRVKQKEGRLKGYLEMVGFEKSSENTFQILTQDVLKSNEIEGELLDKDQVRSSIARRLGLSVAGLIPSDRNIDGVVEMMLDATQNYQKPLTQKRLFAWHASLFPTGYSGMHAIEVAKWRTESLGPMQVVSGAMGKERVHFEAPAAHKIAHEMKLFLAWFNAKQPIDDFLKSALAHLWFLTIHPFDDGNGRIARAIADMQLARADKSSQRFFSMSAQIRLLRKSYYEILERTQSGNLNITSWMLWYLKCVDAALSATDDTLKSVVKKTHFWDQQKDTLIHPRQRKIINLLFDGFEGKLNSSKYAKINKCSADTALRDIQDLIEKRILIKEEAGGRSTNYLLV